MVANSCHSTVLFVFNTETFLQGSNHGNKEVKASPQYWSLEKMHEQVEKCKLMYFSVTMAPVVPEF